MKEHVTLALLAAYALMVFVCGFVWEQLRESWTHPPVEKATTHLPARRREKASALTLVK
jgi:hypothetical protein